MDLAPMNEIIEVNEENKIKLPLEVREEFGLEPGTKLLIKAEPPYILLKPISDKQDLLEYLDEIEEKEEPGEIDWDEVIYSELEKD
ncbi:hypothetical protein C9439_04125 [archaeon SCG-AAA382B04]|nr:hypothetical protein C9439_04125 [archaeon SCG-AAA382B04]